MNKDLKSLRLKYLPSLAPLFKNFMGVAWKENGSFKGKDLYEAQPITLERKPLRCGIFLSGGPAPGGHNVIIGLSDALKQWHGESKLFGFLKGADGLINKNYKELKKEEIDLFCNSGGFDLIGSGRTKIETSEQFQKALETVKTLQLNGLVVVGGDDSNTNAFYCSEYFKQQGYPISVIGIPKTIDGDLKNEYIEISFGFDTACKTYAELIGNIAHDTLSARKYYHFIRLMGRSASHILLECALKTQPNLAFVGEELLKKKKTLKEITYEIADLIEKRKKAEKPWGVFLFPEGLVEFIPEMQHLLEEINQGKTHSLSEQAQSTWNLLPSEVQKQLLLEKDPHGNVQVSQIEIERLFMDLVAEELKKREFTGFSAIPHFFGYEGRAAFPTNFDATYTYNLGWGAFACILSEKTGVMCFIQHLKHSVKEWKLGALSLEAMMDVEWRNGQQKKVIQKTLVDLTKEPFLTFAHHREFWKEVDHYLFPGPIQFFGEEELTDSKPYLLGGTP